jgi:hypothetical protein
MWQKALSIVTLWHKIHTMAQETSRERRQKRGEDRDEEGETIDERGETRGEKIEGTR